MSLLIFLQFRFVPGPSHVPMIPVFDFVNGNIVPPEPLSDDENLLSPFLLIALFFYETAIYPWLRFPQIFDGMGGVNLYNVLLSHH